MRIKILIALLFIPIVSSLAPIAQAQVTILPGTGELAEKIQTGEIHLTDLPLFIIEFINFGLIIAGSISLLFLVIGGYRYIIGGVVQAQREQGKNTIIYALLGLVIALLSWAIVNTVQLLVT